MLVFMPSDDRPAQQRLIQGAALLVGAVLLVLVVGEESSRFYLLPGALGLIYLAAALAGGRRGSYWATALVLLGFGAAVVIVQRTRPELATDGLELLGAGLGALVGAVLARRGVAVDPIGAAATIALLGLLAALRPVVSEVTDLTYYAVLVGLVGLFNLVAGAVRLRGEREHGREGATAG